MRSPCANWHVTSRRPAFERVSGKFSYAAFTLNTAGLFVRLTDRTIFIFVFIFTYSELYLLFSDWTDIRFPVAMRIAGTAAKPCINTEMALVNCFTARRL